jgi:Protein of unknown function DUF262/Protein of unknown function (DUF1524)
MNGNFTAQAVSLGALLSGSAVYAIPGFQRPYSWTTVEVARLLDDILFAVTDGEPPAETRRVFFLGTVVLIATDEGTDAAGRQDIQGNFDVVDGQQRLVTLTMMFAALRDLARAEGDTELAARLDRHIAALPDGMAGGRGYRVVLRAQDEAVLAGYVQQMDGCLAEADPEAFEGPQRNLIANRNYLFEELGALDRDVRRRIAEFLENDCQVVSISTNDTDNAFRIFMVVNQVGKPLLRNDLLKAELIGALPAEDRAAYIERWETAEQACGAEFEQLFSHFRTAFGNGRAPIINEIRRLVRQGGGAKAFLDRQFLPAADVYSAMQGRPAGAPVFNAPALRSLRNLERLSHTDWVPPALLWTYLRGDDPAATVEFLTALDRYAYAHLGLGIGRDKRVARYGGIADTLRTGNGRIDLKALLSQSADEQRNFLFNATNDLYGRSSMGCKLLLLRLNDAMGGSALPADLSDVTVEHVLPQKINRNSPWRTIFNDAQIPYYTGSLGNLALVTAATNKAVRNFDFEKKSVFYRQDALMQSMPLNAGLVAAQRFGPADIQRREERMIAVMRDLWGLTAAVDRRPPR